MEYQIYLSPPHMSGREMQYIQETFDTNWIAPVGPNVDAFEQALCAYTGGRHALAVSSGTAALHLALLALGIGRGDIVLCQSLTFVATANPIVYVGATPVFIDSEPVTWNMCPNALEDAIRYYVYIGQKPKAVIVVHLYGMPAQLDPIVHLCRAHGIALIEDAAEALGSTYRGQQVGTFGDIGILSFNGNKIITTSGGGALLSDRAEWIERARFLATQARGLAMHYDHREVGYNYRMSNVCAGIGRGQMEVIEERVAQRRANFDTYRDQLSSISEIGFQREPEEMVSNRWLTAILLERKGVCEALKSHQIESRPIWKPMHLQPLFTHQKYFGLNVAQSLFERGICLPSGTSLTRQNILFISNVIKGI